MTGRGGGNGVGWDSDVLCDSIWLYFVDAGRIRMVMNADNAPPSKGDHNVLTAFNAVRLAFTFCALITMFPLSTTSLMRMRCSAATSTTA